MTKVYTGASMSLDGYIAGPNESGFEQLFQWYANGDVEVPTTKPQMTMRMTAVSAEPWSCSPTACRRAGRGRTRRSPS